MVGDRRRSDSGRRQPHPLYVLLKNGVLIAVVLALLALIAIVAATLLRPDISGPAYLALINVNLVLLGVVVVFTMRRLLVMFLDRRGRLKGGRLHLRVLGIFSLLAVVPAVAVMTFAVYLMNQGVESWFSDKVNGALEGSLQVAQAYLEEHEKALLVEVDSLAKDRVWNTSFLLLDRDGLRDWLRAQMDDRKLSELAVVDENGNVLVTASDMGGFAIPPDVMANIRVQGEIAQTFKNINDGRVLAVAPLRDGMMLVGQRWVNPAVLSRVDKTNEAFREYDGLRKERQRIKLLANLFLIGLTVTAMAGAVWTGIQLATRIVRPVTALVHATNRVSAGDLDVRLTPERDDELGVLTQAFNRMALQLQNSRDLLERKNREMDDRRKVMEGLLTGVTAGVVSMDASGNVKLANQAAESLLGLKMGQNLSKVAPAIGEMLGALVEHPRQLYQQQLKIEGVDGDSKTLQVRMVPQFVEGGKVGTVVATFDDVTPLIGAQRLAAWRDVARRLAHEIKNPLTPIQLSAERLKRKYMSAVPEGERELFKQLTETIVRQTEDMRKLTNEFSDFARMPEAVMEPQNLIEMMDSAIVLQKAGRSKITFETEYKVPVKDAGLLCDRGQLNRVFVNVLENAVNAIEEREGSNVEAGKVQVVVKKPQADMLQVTVMDNGKGLPPDVEVDHLFDPYVTTRKNGTGLGLAIVRRVMDEHGGQVRLLRRPQGGTAVELSFAVGPQIGKENKTNEQPKPAAERV